MIQRLSMTNTYQSHQVGMKNPKELTPLTLTKDNIFDLCLTDCLPIRCSLDEPEQLLIAIHERGCFCSAPNSVLVSQLPVKDIWELRLIKLVKLKVTAQ